jgi:hypothetical protein
MKSKFIILFLVLVFIKTKAQIQSGNSYIGSVPEGEALCKPSEFADGWIEDDKGNKQMLKLKFRIKNQEILFTKDGNTFAAKGSVRKFSYTDAETGESHFFKKIATLNKFVEVLNDSLKITLVTLYTESESENTDYADVKRKSKDLEKTYYIFDNEKLTKIKLTKKEILKLYPKLKSYFKENKIDLKNRQDLNALFLILNKD